VDRYRVVSVKRDASYAANDFWHVKSQRRDDHGSISNRRALWEGGVLG